MLNMALANSAHFCFPLASRHSSTLSPFAVQLSEPSALALAQLVPLLGCGEEAAALAFDGLAQRTTSPVAQHALRHIAAEEAEHEGLLRRLAASLPDIDESRLRARARRFHIDLGRGDDDDHLARIAAIDAGVCSVLSRLLRRGRPLAADQAVATLLTRIWRDEARHVSLSRTLAVQRRPSSNLVQLAAAARAALADVLGMASDAFEALGVDPDRLSADLRAVPRGLFPA